MASDFEQPTSPSDYRSGFFGGNFVSDPAGAFTNWISPGDRFFRVKYGMNFDETIATQAEIDAATSQWENMTRCERWRIRLHHEAVLRWQHGTNSKVFIYYHSGIPAAKKAQIVTCLDENTFEYLGQTSADVITKLNDRNPALLAHFWPTGVPDTAVFGWESDFGL